MAMRLAEIITELLQSALQRPAKVQEMKVMLHQTTVVRFSPVKNVHFPTATGSVRSKTSNFALFFTVVRFVRPFYYSFKRPRSVFFFAGAVRARSSDGHQSIGLDCPFPRMRIM